MKTEGDLSVIPQNREYKILFVNIKNANVKVTQGERTVEAAAKFEENGLAVSIPCGAVSESIEITLTDVEMVKYDVLSAVEEVLWRAEVMIDEKSALFARLNKADNMGDTMSYINEANMPKELKEALVECYSAE